MAKYAKISPRIPVKFINNNTEEELFEIIDRSWMNVGELFPDHAVTALMNQELKNRPEPDEIMVMAVAIYRRVD
jgi:hypothetical protein